MRTKLRRGDIVRVSCPEAEVGERGPLRAMVALANHNGKRLFVMYDGVLDGCVAAMPLTWSKGTFRNLITQRPIDVLVEAPVTDDT